MGRRLCWAGRRLEGPRLKVRDGHAVRTGCRVGLWEGAPWPQRGAGGGRGRARRGRDVLAREDPSSSVRGPCWNCATVVCRGGWVSLIFLIRRHSPTVHHLFRWGRGCWSAKSGLRSPRVSWQFRRGGPQSLPKAPRGWGPVQVDAAEPVGAAVLLAGDVEHGGCIILAAVGHQNPGAGPQAECGTPVDDPIGKWILHGSEALRRFAVSGRVGRRRLRGSRLLRDRALVRGPCRRSRGRARRWGRSQGGRRRNRSRDGQGRHGVRRGGGKWRPPRRTQCGRTHRLGREVAGPV